uniref:DUF2971 domain-containing protein n=1 Tax=Desulfovibrio sp. U5L TaxID=596152 RepID=I2PWW8_9BACT
MSNVIKRYTELSYMLHMLTSKKIRLLDPRFWDDKNDFYFMSRYKSLKKIQSILALCFTEGQERYHHWKVFSGTASGVRIDFNKGNIISTIKSIAGIRYGNVCYEKLNKLEACPPNIKDIPFIKRHAYYDEKEFRIIYEDDIDEIYFYDIDFKIQDIENITLNPWISKDCVESIRKLVHKIDGCSKIKVKSSYIINSERWKNLAK